MQRVWHTPGGEYPAIYHEMLKQTHLLIAGCTGAGKSTVVNGIMYTALYDSPARVQFVLIDPKGTELSMYERLPHTLKYGQTVPDCIAALQYAMQLTRQRFDAMKRAGDRMYDGTDVYVVIDELMYLMNQSSIKKQTIKLLLDIMVIARAARVHVIACTQFIPAIPTNIRCNFDCKLALRTATAQDSRNVLGVKGCETFPVPTLEHKAYGAYMVNGIIQVYNLPRIDDNSIDRMIKHWIKQKRLLRAFFSRG